MYWQAGCEVFCLLHLNLAILHTERYRVWKPARMQESRTYLSAFNSLSTRKTRIRHWGNARVRSLPSLGALWIRGILLSSLVNANEQQRFGIYLLLRPFYKSTCLKELAAL